MKAMFRTVVEKGDSKYRALEFHEWDVFALAFVFRDGHDPDGWARELVEDLGVTDVQKALGNPLEDGELYEVYGQMSCHSSESWTDWGMEYDSWAEFSELNVRKLDPEERKQFQEILDEAE